MIASNVHSGRSSGQAGHGLRWMAFRLTMIEVFVCLGQELRESIEQRSPLSLVSSSSSLSCRKQYKSVQRDVPGRTRRAPGKSSHCVSSRNKLSKFQWWLSSQHLLECLLIRLDPNHHHHLPPGNGTARQTSSSGYRAGPPEVDDD